MDSSKKRVSFFKQFKTPLCMLFSFTIGCMFTNNLVRLDKTCKIEDVHKGFDMRNSDLKNFELIILILSAPTNNDRRQAIRDSWIKLNNVKNRYSFQHFFVIGTSNLSKNLKFELDEEQKRFNDVLMLPLKDSYENLTLKVLKSFEWLNEQYDLNGLIFKYVLKCDDDSFVRVDNLIHEIQHIEIMYLKSKLSNVLELVNENSSPYITLNAQIDALSVINNLSVYWGYFDGRASIKTVGKWKENNWFACDKYIPYALGGGYILSKALVTYIAKNSMYLMLYNSEDVSMGIWLASVKNILRIHDIRFDTEWNSRGCKNFHLITHNVKILKMREMYFNIMKHNVSCFNENLVRNFYLYNWSASPSNCCIKQKLKKPQT